MTPLNVKQNLKLIGYRNKQNDTVADIVKYKAYRPFLLVHRIAFDRFQYKNHKHGSGLYLRLRK